MGGVRVGRNIPYAARRDGPMTGTLYQPAANEGPYPAIVAVHGGGWRRASASFPHLAPWLARQGYAVFTPTYRLATPDHYPAAVHDIRAAVQFIKGRAGDLNIVANCIALLGVSAGGHLASLVALGGDHPTFDATDETGEFGHLSTQVKVAVPVYGIYDLVQQWRHDQLTRPGDHLTEKFLGQSLLDDRRLYFDASLLSYVSRNRNTTEFLIAWGTEDDVVDRASSLFLFWKR